VTPEAIDKYCAAAAPRVYGSGVDLPVYNSLYCKKCKVTHVIRASLCHGFSDFEDVFCPRCKRKLGEIRADVGFTFVEEKQGNFGNGQWQGPDTVAVPFEA
jgi:hypothetical protein